MADELSDEIRAKVDALIERAQTDEAFLERFRSDTTGVLVEAGVPDETATMLAEHDLGFADVAGYLRPSGNRPGGYCHFTCDEYSCQISVCNFVPFTN